MSSQPIVEFVKYEGPLDKMTDQQDRDLSVYARNSQTPLTTTCVRRTSLGRHAGHS